MLDAVIGEIKAAGLRTNVANTKYMVRGVLAPTLGTIGWCSNYVDDFKYLDRTLTSVARRSYAFVEGAASATD